MGLRGRREKGEWRKLQNEKLNDLYCLPNIVRVIKTRTMKWDVHVARMEDRRGVYRVLVGKPEGKRLLERPRRSWKDNIKWIFWKCDGGMDWIELAQDRDRWRAIVNKLTNFPVP